MSTHDGGLSAREHDEMRDLVLAGTQRIRPAGSHRAQFVAVGVSLILVGAVTGGVITATLRDDGSARPRRHTESQPDRHEPKTAGSRIDTGWPKEEIYFVEPGFGSACGHRVRRRSRGQVCPAFSSDGTRLASGQGGYGQQEPKDGALVISDLTAEGEVAASEVIPLDGLRQQPCPIWSPDGRWVAFGVGSELQRAYQRLWRGRRRMGVQHRDGRGSPPEGAFGDRHRVGRRQFPAVHRRRGRHPGLLDRRRPDPHPRRQRRCDRPDRVARRPLARRRA